MLVAGRISWTQYKFLGNSHLLAEDNYQSLRQFDAKQLDELLADIRRERWKQFRASHRVLLWVGAIAGISVVLASAVPVFGIIAFVGWVCVLSLGLSAFSCLNALNRECQYLRRCHQIAARSASCQDFEEQYLRSLANFNLLRRNAYYYGFRKPDESEAGRKAAENTFILLKWSAEWKGGNEYVHYPAHNRDQTNCVKINVYPTSTGVWLAHTFICLKFNAKNKGAQEKLVRAFEQTFQEEFGKWFALREANGPGMAELANHASLSPYWESNSSGAFSLKRRTDSIA